MKKCLLKEPISNLYLKFERSPIDPGGFEVTGTNKRTKS
jgi:hypothetical protein